MSKKGLLLLILVLLLQIPFLGTVHLFDWDEANFAELAREMIVSGDFLQPQINFLPFYEKPPLFIWFQVLSMKLFGVNEFAARFPNILCGVLVLISLFQIGTKHFSQRVGFLWALSFGASIAPHFYFKTGLIDPFFNYFIFLSIYFFSFLFLSQSSSSLRNTVLSALFCALAVLTKGPVAIILIVGSLGLGWVFMKFQGWRKIGWVLPWTFVAFILSSIWFYYITKNYGGTYVHEFIEYQKRLFETEDAKHGGTILFHPVALLLGCFPASIFMWTAFRKQIRLKSDMQNVLFRIMAACGIVVLVVFSIVKTKIIHYSSMDYYPISFFSAIGLNYIIEKKEYLKKWQTSAVFFIGGIWVLAFILIPILGIYSEEIKPWIHDQNFREQLKTPIQWNYWASFFGVIALALLYYSRRQWNVNMKKGIIGIFAFCLLSIQIISFYYLPRIEQIVQGSLVQFCQSLRGQDVNTVALYVKSYNQYFYSNRPYFKNIEQGKKHLHYLYDTIDRDCYIIMRSCDRYNFDTAIGPQTSVFLKKEGFIFYKRTKI